LLAYFAQNHFSLFAAFDDLELYFSIFVGIEDKSLIEKINMHRFLEVIRSILYGLPGEGRIDQRGIGAILIV
jgi:hypothetical protein